MRDSKSLIEFPKPYKDSQIYIICLLILIINLQISDIRNYQYRNKNLRYQADDE